MDIRYLLRVLIFSPKKKYIQRRPAMSELTIAPYFPFRRIKIVNQTIFKDAAKAHIQIQPDRRFQPICHCCGHKASGVHSWTERRVRDLNLAATPVWIKCRYRKVFCAQCHRVSVENLELFHPYLRVTSRMARYIYQLCRLMTVADVARHLDLDWKTVKEIDKYYLEREYGQPDLTGLRILAVDEISVRKGHRYLTVVLDYITGRVVFVGQDRKADTLERFFNQLSDAQLAGIEAVVMDMWDPFIKAVKKKCLKLKSYSICFMWSPILAASSTRSETANTTKPARRIKPFTKAPSTCC
jgi:transposase